MVLYTNKIDIATHVGTCTSTFPIHRLDKECIDLCLQTKDRLFRNFGLPKRSTATAAGEKWQIATAYKLVSNQVRICISKVRLDQPLRRALLVNNKRSGGTGVLRLSGMAWYCMVLLVPMLPHSSSGGLWPSSQPGKARPEPSKAWLNAEFPTNASSQPTAFVP